MKAQIAVLAGDGVGPEVTREAERVLQTVSQVFGHEFKFEQALVGGAAIDAHNTPLPDATLDLCKQSAAVLFGAIGGPKWDHPTAKVKPEQGLLGLRKGLGLYANLRPVAIHPALINASPLKPEILKGVDMLVVRELTGGIYFGEKKRDAFRASDLCVYTVPEIERIVRAAAKLAQQRRGKLTSVDKANVLETSRLWRLTTERLMQSEFPEIKLDHLLVDSAAMHLIRRPSDFDVIVTENMFGDILTDEASMLAGSMGMLPSASLGEGTFGLYEPIHGSAPDIAGKGIANPYAAILSAAMLLRYSLDLSREADAVEQACAQCIGSGYLTADLRGSLSTQEVGYKVVAELEQVKP
jgi:3-isopropylmalate dehydrogenase